MLGDDCSMLGVDSMLGDDSMLVDYSDAKG